MTRKKAKPRPWGEIRNRRDRPGFRVRFTWQGVTYERAAGTSWSAADKKRRETRVLLERGVPIDEVLSHIFGDLSGARLSFKDAAPHYLAYAATRKRESTLKGDTHRLRLLCRAPWAKKVLSRIRPEDFLPWLADRQKARVVMRKRKRRPGESLAEYRKAKDRMEEHTIPGASGATLNRDLTLASALFRWAIRAGYCDENPVSRVERFNERGRARETYLTAEESNALIEACSPVLRPFVLTALHTGMRRGELLALRWRAVDLKRRELLVEPESEKAGRGRVIPLTETLYGELASLKALRPLPALDGSDHVFVFADGAPLRVHSLRRLWESTVDRCDAIALAKRQRLSLHSLRHTCASLMVGAGVQLFDVAKILGHSTLSVTMRYAHFAPEAGVAAVHRLGQALSTEEPRARRSGSRQ